MDISDKLIYYLIFIAICSLFSLLINGLFLRFARTLGIRNHKENDTIVRWGSTSKPAFGGISFYILFLFSISVYSMFFDMELNKEILGVLIASSIGFLIGLADDAYNTQPLLKLAGQIIAAIVLVATDNVIHLFEFEWLNIALSLFWIIGMMNSINMLDNMDAITTSVSLGIVSSAVFVILLQSDYNSIYLMILLGVSAGLLGFLYYNWNPSKMYMGDTGSQFLGVFLAVIGIKYFWNFQDGNSEMVFSKQALTAVLVFIIPIIDTTTVVINRLKRGQSPMVGGRDHTTHNLTYLGFTDRHVALMFIFLSIVSLGIVIYIYKYAEEWSYVHILTISGYCIGLFSFLFYISRKFEYKQTKNVK